MTTVPYVISTAYPDYKTPYLHQEFGICQIVNVRKLLIDKCVEFILEMMSYKYEKIQTVNDVQFFFNNYYEECYMDNYPWEAVIFADGEWCHIIPSDQELFDRIQILKKKELENNKSEIDDDNNVNDDDDNDYDDDLHVSEEDKEFFKNFYGKLKEASNYKDDDETLSIELKQKKFIKHIQTVLNEKFVENNKEISKQFIEKTANYLDKEIEVKSLELEEKINSDDDSINKSDLVEYLRSLISLRCTINSYHNL